MTLVASTPELAGLLADADHVDVRGVEATATLREFVAAAMSWRPAWLTVLFHARTVLARMLRLRDAHVTPGRPLRPEEVSFTPVARTSFFTVTAGAEDRPLVLEASDNHLTAW